MEIKDLTFEQVKQLRREIVLNSLFTSDFKNSFDIDPHEVQDYFDGYSEYLGELIKEKHPNVNDDDWWKELERLDNNETLEQWFGAMELLEIMI